ncbi:LuxR C-terminal-related transcriptional regulator [Nocardioides sp. TF02-7]|uniref:LuxR C-terminal-related transcriptional regulator n=1 Tax=Nocardioides sp. TF02-7 TaxID=2917724 RepID=UPI001F05F262|nr:LuxR C-terminal-related transcriptional regulator [Nocardioides sp. TF02-7]UMG93869.1 LuxR C-terminal-related transcriptional regulator [Nocardioides sp. TF02-7]
MGGHPAQPEGDRPDPGPTDPADRPHRRIRRAPRLPSVVIERPRLLTRLDTGSPLTLVRAPVGFGKTTLLTQWARRLDPAAVTAVWFRVRRGAADPAAFWAGLLEVLADAGLAVPPRRSWPTGSYDLAGLVERALLAAHRPVVLVVDGFDRAGDAEVELTLVDIVRHVPDLRLVVTFRDHRSFTAPRHLDVDTAVVTARDLRFTVDETAELLAVAGRAPSSVLASTLASTLHGATAGWPEVTRAAVLRLQDDPTADPAVVPAVVDRVASDYLEHRLVPQTRGARGTDLALVTSVADGFTEELAAVLTGGDDVKPDIEALVADGLLLAERVDGDWVYRWPTHARAALERELARTSPERVPGLHTRLAQWHLENAEPAAALHHARRSGDAALVVRVIEEAWLTLAIQHPDDLHRAFVETPLEPIAASSRALAARDIYIGLPDGYLPEIARLPAREDELTALAVRSDGAEIVDSGLAVLVALRRRGALAAATAYGDRLVRLAAAARAAHPARVVPLHPSVRVQVGMAELLVGDLPAAQESLREAHALSGDDPFGYVEATAAAHLALSHASVGDLRQSATWLERYDAAPDPPRSTAPVVRATVAAARLFDALDRLDLDRAQECERVLAGRTGREETWPFLTAALCSLALHTGTAQDAVVELRRQREARGELTASGSFAGASLAAVEVSLLLALGRGNSARAVLEGPFRDHPLLRAGRARLALMAGDAAEALRIATDIGWEESAIPRHRLEVLLLRAVAAHRQGEQAHAREALRRAVATGRATGSVRAFTTVPRADLLDLARHDEDARDFVSQEPLASAPDLFPGSVSLVELTPRERQVLAGLAAGLTTQQVADRSVVSYNTVRTQQRSLYRKLGTSDRADAIARARALGLLPARRVALRCGP